MQMNTETKKPTIVRPVVTVNNSYKSPSIVDNFFPVHCVLFFPFLDVSAHVLHARSRLL